MRRIILLSLCMLIMLITNAFIIPTVPEPAVSEDTLTISWDTVPSGAIYGVSFIFSGSPSYSIPGSEGSEEINLAVYEEVLIVPVPCPGYILVKDEMELDLYGNIHFTYYLEEAI